MPIYEYCCEACGNNFESLVFGDECPTCPNCESPKVCKQMSACGFVSKGSGGQTVGKSAGSACSGCKPSAGCAGCSK